MRKLLAIFVFLFAASASLRADGDGKRGYAPSAFGDNWFIQAGGGANFVLNSPANGSPVLGVPGPAAELYVGKWFTPSVGVRLGALGIKNRPNGTQTGWFSGRNPFWFGHADIDVMWNILNTFNYNELRVWDLVPYLRGSAIYTNQGEGGHVEPGFGFGLHNGIRLGKRVDLYLEVSMVGAREKAYRQRGRVGFFPTASAGVVLKLGRVGFRKNQPVYIKGDTQIITQVDTVTVEKKVIETVVDSVTIQKLRMEPLTVFFDIDVTVLNQRELDHLEFYAKWALTPDSVVLLTGSADKETGNPEHNQWLSEQRNAYVRDILIRLYGLKPENIQEIANGDRKNEFRTSEQNRCVTIRFIK